MKYLIGLDIDGTLITDDNQLTKETIEYIKELSKDGHIVSLVTGRPFRTTLPIYNELCLDTPMGNYSGSLLQHPRNKDFPGYKFTMDQSYVLDIFKKFKNGIHNAFLEIEDKVYLFKEDNDLKRWLSANADSIETGDFEGRVNHPLCGAVFFISPDISCKLEEFVNNFYRDKIGFRHWHSNKEHHVVELFTLFASKATALEAIREYYDIPIENTIAIGDGTNDLEMLEYATHSAAMKNAKDIVKESAKSITDSNNENGVINFIKSIIK